MVSPKNRVLHADGIDEAIRRINAIIRAVKKAQERLLDAMIQDGETVARSNVGHIDTGETMSTIYGYRSGDSGFVVAGGNAIWIEFGTGVRKNSAKHPPVVDDGGNTIYEWGTFGEGKGSNPDGWYYPTYDGRYAVRNANGEYYMTNDGQYIAHTYGIPANFFMSKTAEQVLKDVPKLAKKSIRLPRK